MFILPDAHVRHGTKAQRLKLTVEVQILARLLFPIELKWAVIVREAQQLQTMKTGLLHIIYLQLRPRSTWISTKSYTTFARSLHIERLDTDVLPSPGRAFGI